MARDEGWRVPRNPSSVLFCCTSNSLRSPMAAAITDFLIGREVLVDSVGLRRRGVDPFAVAVMDEIGIDLAHHRAKTFDDLDGEPFDLIVSLSPEAQHHAVEMTRRTATEVEFWKTFDPSIIEGNRDVRLTAYRGVRDALLSRIKQRFTLPGTPV